MNNTSEIAQYPSNSHYAIQKTVKYLLFKLLRLFKSKEAKKRISNYSFYQVLFNNKCGLEIGGPSEFFKLKIPIYKKLKSLDGVNFNSSTVWEGKLVAGKTFKYWKQKKGNQFIYDAVNLEGIESNKYDFVLSCNNLEHIANPLKALAEWLRLLKPGGLILLVLPNKVSNFDHKREVTSFDHIINDFNNAITEQDLTHLDEILSLHDLSMDPLAGAFDTFKNRSMINFQNRCLHHHVFDTNLLKRIFQYFNIEVLTTDVTDTDFIILGKSETMV